LYEPQPEKTFREIVRDTFTPSRVGILSWAFAALVMGTVGLASYQFGSRAVLPSASRLMTGALPLPPGGDVSTTASISSSASPMPVNIMRMPEQAIQQGSSALAASQIEVLQREVVSLRRRISALSDQNLTYSRRIAALEKEVALAKLAGTGKSGPAREETFVGPAEPGPGVVITKAAPETGPLRSDANPVPPVALAAGEKAMTAPEQKLPVSLPKTSPRMISIYRNPEATLPTPDFGFNAQEPVRIVKLPEVGAEPQATASIPTRSAASPPEMFNATPTTTSPQPPMITPSNPAGKLRGSGDSQLNRSDFGAVIGYYRTDAGAAKAWADFKEQNEERMRDLRPLLMDRQEPEGGVALLVGPFANAADAAIACLRLLDVTETCRPALYAGDPLVAAAEFRDTAF